MIRPRKEAEPAFGQNLDKAPKTEVAYNLEAQEIVVAKAQQQGRLSDKTLIFERLEMRRELGHRWYLLYSILGSRVVLFGGDCDESVIEQLRRLKILREVSTRDNHPEATFGRKKEVAVAAVFLGEQVLFKSPGFNLEAFHAQERAAQESPKSRLPKISLPRFFNR